MQFLKGYNFTQQQAANQLGINQHSQLHKYNKIINLPYGFILVTGPTGSGKSTTLYATLVKLNSVDKHIITLEDSIERKLDGLNQIQVNVKAGMTFASYRPRSCSRCNHTGHKGRVGIYEVLYATEAIQKLILSRSSSQEIKDKAVEEGMLTLRQDGLLKVKEGLTSLEEVLRVAM